MPADASATPHLLHLVIGGELKSLNGTEFRDLNAVEFVGAYGSYAEASSPAWSWSPGAR